MTDDASAPAEAAALEDDTGPHFRVQTGVEGGELDLDGCYRTAEQARQMLVSIVQGWAEAELDFRDGRDRHVAYAGLAVRAEAAELPLDATAGAMRITLGPCSCDNLWQLEPR